MRRNEPASLGLPVVVAVGWLFLAHAAPADGTGAQRLLDRGVRACLERLRETDVEGQTLCLRRLREAGPAASVATQALSELLARSDGDTDHVLVASALDVLRALGSDAAPAAETLSSLLPHRSRLYKGRDKVLVVRLRAYIVVTLSEIGFPSSALPALVDTLAHVDVRMTAIEVGAAARAVGSLGARGREFAPYLLDTLIDRFDADEFSLERYDPQFPPHEATTVQLEAVRAMGRVCSAEDDRVLTVFRQLAENPSDGEHDPRLAGEAQRALELIGGAGGHAEARGERK